MRKTLILIILIATTFPAMLFGYGDKETHPLLTRRAIENSVTGDVFIKQLGFTNELDKIKLHASIYNGVDYKDKSWSVIDLLRYGAEMEDNPMCRASNHFLNPLTV